MAALESALSACVIHTQVCCLFLGIPNTSTDAEICAAFRTACRPMFTRAHGADTSPSEIKDRHARQMERVHKSMDLKIEFDACLARVEEARADVPRLLGRAFLGGITGPIQPDAGSAMCEVHQFFSKYPGLQRQIGGLIARYGTS